MPLEDTMVKIVLFASFLYFWYEEITCNQGYKSNTSPSRSQLALSPVSLLATCGLTAD